MSEGTGLILIGCGLPRTGTLSTKAALEMILPGKCHHMITAFLHEAEWRDILSGDADDVQFRTFFIQNGYVAAVDAPFCYHYERAMKLFPNAKVLLNVREPQKWAKSVKETILVAHTMAFPVNLFNYLRLFTSYLGLFPTLFSALNSTADYQEFMTQIKADNGVAYYNKWVSDVVKTVPADKLLKFNVTDGWEPLCKFLNVPVPEGSFPNVNKRQSFVERQNWRKRRAWLLLYELVTIPLFTGLFYCYA